MKCIYSSSFISILLSSHQTHLSCKLKSSSLSWSSSLPKLHLSIIVPLPLLSFATRFTALNFLSIVMCCFYYYFPYIDQCWYYFGPISATCVAFGYYMQANLQLAITASSFSVPLYVRSVTCSSRLKAFKVVIFSKNLFFML